MSAHSGGRGPGHLSRKTVVGTFSPGGTPDTSLTISTAPTISGDPVVGQRLFATSGTYSQTPDSYARQWYKDGSAISGETGDSYLVVDADVGSVFAYKEIASKAGYTSSSLNASSSTAAATDINLTNGITAFARTSASGVTPMTYSISFGSNVYSGYTLLRRKYSDSGLSTLVDEFAHALTGAELAGTASIDLVAEGASAIGATEWVTFTVQTSSPNGVYYGFTFATGLSPTDAVVAMIYSPTDKDASVSVSGGNLTAAWGGGGSTYAGVRANRGVSTGKVYWETTVNVATPRTRLGAVSGTAPLNATWSPANDGGAAQSQAACRYLDWWEFNGTFAQVTPTIANGDNVDTALDATGKKVWWRVNNGSWLPTGDPASGSGGLALTGMNTPIYPAAMFSSGGSVTSNFGTSAFTRTPPSGFVAP